MENKSDAELRRFTNAQLFTLINDCSQAIFSIETSQIATQAAADLSKRARVVLLGRGMTKQCISENLARTAPVVKPTEPVARTLF